jgi:hypothetical protein
MLAGSEGCRLVSELELLKQLEPLLNASAAALVGAMASDAWQAAKSGFTRLFGRGDQRREELAGARLDAAATQVAQVNDNDRERVRQELLPVWQVRLRDLVEEYPEAVEELRALTDRIQAQLPAAQQAWVQHNLARGHGTVYGVQAGDQHIHYHGTPDPPPSRSGPVGPPEDDRGAE